MKRLDDLEIAYTMDLLARLTESIETYQDDDRWDGISAMHKEIRAGNV
jgi:replication-associated recombination protein RarA